MKSVKVTRLPKDTIVRLLMNGTDDFEKEVNEEADSEGTVRETLEDETEEESDDESETATGEKPVSVTSNEGAAEDKGQPADQSTIEFGDPEAYTDQVESLKRALHDFGIDIDGIDTDEVEVGPNLVRYKIKLASGQGQGAIESSSEDIAREMAIEREPHVHRLQGTQYVAVDVPLGEKAMVPMQDYMPHLPGRR